MTKKDRTRDNAVMMSSSELRAAYASSCDNVGVRDDEGEARRGAVWLGWTYGDLKVADGPQVWLRGPEAPSLIGGSEDDELVRSGAYKGLG